MISGEQPVESHLHKTLAEHVNAEVVLGTITDLSIAMQWLSSTFLYIRARKNPKQYSLPLGLTQNQLDKKLLEMCQIEINKLAKAGMLTIDQNILILPTQSGSLMARYCVALETMKLFTQVSGKEVLQQILALISKCREFSEIRLRTNDKRPLNILNKNRDNQTIRFTLSGRIKTLDMKINCIVQAVLGSLEILESSLVVEGQRIMRIGERLLNCLSEYLQYKANCYQALLNSVTLAKCFHARIWENSRYVSRQLDGIGLSLSNLLVTSGKTTFKEILNSNPRDLERILNKKPPMGNKIQDQVKMLPQYGLTVKEVILEDGKVTVELVIVLENKADLHTEITINPNSTMILLVGDTENNILLHEKYTHIYMIENVEITRNIDIKTNFEHEVFVNFISENWVGIDVKKSIKLFGEEEEKVTKVMGPTEEVKILPDSTKGNAKSTGNKKKEKSHKTMMLQQLMDRYFKKVNGVKRENRGVTRKRSSGQVKRKSSTSRASDRKIEKELTNEFDAGSVQLQKDISDEVPRQCEKDLIQDDTPKNNFEKEMPNTDAKKLLNNTQNIISNIAKKSLDIYSKLPNSSIEIADDVVPSTPAAPSIIPSYAKSRQNTLYKTNTSLVRQRKQMLNQSKVLEFENSLYTPTDKSKIDITRFAKKHKEKLEPNILKYDDSPKKIHLEGNKENTKTLTWSSPLVISPKSKDSQQFSKNIPAVVKTDDNSSSAPRKLPSLRDNFENYSLSDKDCAYNQEGEYQKYTDVVSTSLLECLGLKTTKSDTTFPTDCLPPSNWMYLEKDGSRSSKCDLNQTVSSASSSSTHVSKAPKIKIIDSATYCSQILKQASENRVLSKSIASQTEDQDFNNQDGKEGVEGFKNDEKSIPIHQEPLILEKSDGNSFCESPNRFKETGIKRAFEVNDKSENFKSKIHKKQSWEEDFFASEPFSENFQNGDDQDYSRLSFEHIDVNKLDNTQASTFGELFDPGCIVNKNNQQAVVSNKKYVDQSRNYSMLPNCAITKEVPEEDQPIFRKAYHDENQQAILNNNKHIDRRSNYFTFSNHTITKEVPKDQTFIKHTHDDIFQEKGTEKIMQENRDSYCSNFRSDLVFQEEPRKWTCPTNFLNDIPNKPAYESNDQYQHRKILNESFYNKIPHPNYLRFRENHLQELPDMRTCFKEDGYLPKMEAPFSANHRKYVQNYGWFGDMDKDFESGGLTSNFSRKGRFREGIFEPASNPAYSCHPRLCRNNSLPADDSRNLIEVFPAKSNNGIMDSGFEECFNHSNLFPNHSSMKDIDEVGYFYDADKENYFDDFNKKCFESIRDKPKARSSSDRFLLRQQEVQNVECQDANCKKCGYKSRFGNVNRPSSSTYYENKNLLFNSNPAYHDIQNNQQRNVYGLNEMNRNNFLLSRYFNSYPEKRSNFNPQFMNLNHTVTSESPMHNLNHEFDF